MKVSVLWSRSIVITVLSAQALAGCTLPGPAAEPTATSQPTATSEPPATATSVATATVPATATPTDTPVPPTVTPTKASRPGTPTVDRVDLFFVALGDGGQSGEEIGCGDSLVAVEQEIEPTEAPLTAALEALFSVGQYYGQSGLYNSLYQSDLQVDGIDVEDGAATIRLSGTVSLGGVCDNPRFAAQLRETALQFSTVGEVSIFINDQPLDEILSLGGEPSPTPEAVRDCVDQAPFAAGCLDQSRPTALVAAARFTGILPAGDVRDAAWNANGTALAYAVRAGDSGGFEGLVVRSAPDFRLEGRWPVSDIFDLTWAPAGRRVLFIFDRGDTTSIGRVRLGQGEWRDLLPGDKARLAVSGGKGFVAWPSANVLAFRVNCGTGCETLYTLELGTGALDQLQAFGTEYLFSPGHRRLAINDWGRGVPFAKILSWPAAGEPLDLAAQLEGRPTAAQSWTDGALAFVAYPAGDLQSWAESSRPELFVWHADERTARRVVSDAFAASFAPGGDRLAVLFVGEPVMAGDGVVQTSGSVPHLSLLTWPEARLLDAYRVGQESLRGWDLLDPDYLSVLTWSPEGSALAFAVPERGLNLMARDGSVVLLLEGKRAFWAGWGAGGTLALIVGDELAGDHRLWLVQT